MAPNVGRGESVAPRTGIYIARITYGALIQMGPQEHRWLGADRHRMELPNRAELCRLVFKPSRCSRRSWWDTHLPVIWGLFHDDWGGGGPTAALTDLNPNK